MTLRTRALALGLALAAAPALHADEPALRTPRDAQRDPAVAGQVDDALRRLPSRFTNSIGVEMVLIPGGTFEMGNLNGSTPQDYGYLSATGFAHADPVHTVELSPFYMARTELTRAQRDAFDHWTGNAWNGGSDPDDWAALTLEGAHSLTHWLSFQQTEDEVPGTYTLPTEAQWEYACRAGTTTEYHWGDEMDESRCVVDHDAQTGALGYPYPEPVASFPPNAFGLYDMHGNAAEWCLDVWRPDFYSQPEASGLDPVCTDDGEGQVGLFGEEGASEFGLWVVRGGSHADPPERATSWYRSIGRRNPGSADHHGVRLVLIPDPPPDPEPPTTDLREPVQPIDRVVPAPVAPRQPITPRRPLPQIPRR